MKIIEKDIETGKFQNVYLLYGEESYLKRQYKEKLLHALIEKGDTMNFSSYSGKEINPNELIDLAQTMPFFAERRVILVEDSLFFKNTCEELVSYLQELPEQTCFLFVESVVDKRSKMYKQVKKVGRITCFDRQKDDVLMRWVGSRLKKEGKTMTKVAYQQFITKTGDDMENIDKELEKLICYCMDFSSIDIEQVNAICTEQVTNRIFDMVNAISERNQKKALDLYYDLLTLKEPPMRILFLVLRQFQKLLLIQELSEQRMDSRTIASKAGIPEFAVRKNQAMLKNFKKEQLRSAVDFGVELEESVKTGNLNERIAVELLTVRLSDY